MDLIVDFRVEEANGYAERTHGDSRCWRDHAIKDGTQNHRRRRQAGYDKADFVRDCRAINVTPHIAQTRDTRRIIRYRRPHHASSPATSSVNANENSSRRSSAG